MEIWMVELLDALTESSYHFWLSGLAGLLAFWLTWITLYVLLQLIYRFGRPRISTAARFGMIGFPILALVSFALLAHWALDWFSIWYTMPLGPPLELDL